MLSAAALALLLTVALALARAALGPSVFDRLQAASTIGTCAMLLLALLGFLDERPEFLDLALTYGLLNVIGVIAVLKFFHLGRIANKSHENAEDA
ncbi:MAG: pH regulation protein [Proteobacteria bacterium]|nr:pH regulation protein [Pseudomonadota bacterium]